MILNSIEWHEDSPRVKLKPTDPIGKFVLRVAEKDHTGLFVVMYDVRRPDALAAELGDVKVLRRYVLPTRELGIYHMVGSCTLLGGDSELIKWFVDTNIQEIPHGLT